MSIPRLRSKFLNRQECNVSVSLPMSDSEDSDEETNASSLFIIDKNPNEISAPKLVKDFDEVKLCSELKPSIDTSGYFKGASSVDSMKQLDKMTIQSSNLEKISVVNGIEKSSFYMESKREQKRRKKLEKEKTKGEQWYNLPAPELTDEKKRDLMLLQMRNVWDSKRFYKKNDSKEIPKYFQVATVLDSAADFYSDRVPRKDRKNTLVDELLADAEFKKWSKKKYVEALKNNPYYLRQARKNKKRMLALKAERQENSGKTDKGAKRHANRLKRRK